MSKAKYRIYTDESGWMEEFASIAAITVDTTKIDISKVEERWKEWKEKKRSSWEMKFTKIKSWDAINAVMGILNDINRKGSGGLRIDILTWRKKEKVDYNMRERYSQDKALAIMYYFLLKEIIHKNEEKIDHELFGDEVSQLKEHWETLKNIFKNEWPKQYIEIYNNLSIPKEDSRNHVFIQLADIMAGFMRHTFTPGSDTYPSYAVFKEEKWYDRKDLRNRNLRSLLCYKIEQWLKDIGIVFFHRTGGGILSCSKYQAVNLWKFQKVKKEPKNTEVKNLSLFDEKSTKTPKKKKTAKTSNNSSAAEEKKQPQLFELPSFTLSESSKKPDELSIS